MKQIILAKRYAKAIFSLGKEQNKIDTYAETLGAIAELYESPEHEVADALTNPLYPLEARQKVMAKIAEAADADTIMAAFLNLLIEKKRVDVLPEIAREVQVMVDREENISHGSVTSAVKLNSALLEKIQATLEKITGNKVILETQVDPSIIGGLVVKLGSRMVDSSLRTKLNSIKHAMTEAG